MEVPRHSSMPSLSADDIARSTFFLGCRSDVNLGSPPDSLALGDRMRWRPVGAGHFVYFFADGLLILTRQAHRSLPRIPPPPSPPARAAVGQAVMLGAHAATGPLSPMVDLLGLVAEGMVDKVLEGVERRYEKAHPEREREHQDKVERWQRQLVADVRGADGIFALSRFDLVTVSVVPFMLYGLNWQFIAENGERSAYTFKSSCPAGEATDTAQRFFMRRMERELAWFARQHADEKLTESELRVRLTQEMRELLPHYGGLPPCARLLDKSLPGWRGAPDS